MKIVKKLATDTHMFDTEARRILYVGDRVGGTAYNHIWPKLDDDEFETAEEVIQFLADIFDDPLKKQKAKQDLVKLFQGNWTFHKYHSEFARITRILKLTEDDLKDELTAKLSKEYSLAVLGDDDLTYAQLVKKLYTVDKKLQAAQALDRSVKNNKSSASGSGGQSGSKTTDAPKGSSTTDKKFPNQRSAEEKALLIEKRLCIKCCKPGHIIPACPEARSLPFPTNLKTILQRPKESQTQISNVEADKADEEVVDDSQEKE
jgi:hypothetical protein